MRKFPVFIVAFLLFSFNTSKPALTDKERKDAIELLSKTEQGVFDALLGMSDAQLNFKAAPDRWSIADCIKHIAVTEQALWQMTDAALKQAANPEKRSQIKASDEQVVQMVEAMREFGEGGMNGSELVGASNQIGVRESRRIKGAYILTEDDAVKGSRFDDVRLE